MKTVLVKNIEAAHKSSTASAMDQHEELDEAGGATFIQEEVRVCPFSSTCVIVKIMILIFHHHHRHHHHHHHHRIHFSRASCFELQCKK